MTIVQLNVSDYGSTGVIMQTVRRIALCKGYKAISFAGRRKHAEEDCRKVGQTAGHYVHGLLARLGKNGHGSFIATRELAAALKKLDPDVVILHNIHGYYLHLKTLFDCLHTLKKAHIFLVLHDCWTFTGGCAYYTGANCRKWEYAGESKNAEETAPHCGKCSIHAKAYPKSLFDTSSSEFTYKEKLFTSLKNMTVIAPSEWIAEEARKSFLGKYEIVVIPNGINVEIFKPRQQKEIDTVLKKYNIPNDKPIILGVASVWDARKQPLLFGALSDIFRGTCSIVMVGLTEAQRKKFPDTATIYSIPRTENAGELACLYSAASLLLNPSLEDNFPLVSLEALACGTPVITSSLCGCPEQVDCDTGIVLANPSSVNEIYRAVITILEAQAKAASLSIKENGDIPYTETHCRERALAYYDHYKMALSYMELIEETLSRHTASPAHAEA